MSDNQGLSYIVLGIGLLAQGLFFGRFLVQWLASEREKRCVVPKLFWHLSIAGSILLLVYAVARHDLIFVLIPLPNLFIYLRNLSLSGTMDEERGARSLSHWWILAPLAVGVVAMVGVVAGARLIEELKTIPWHWAVIGFGGQLLWNGRFLLQLLASERAGRSVLPPSFWYVSLGGCALLLVYAIHRRDPVFIIAMGPNAFIYLRNLYLIRKTRENQKGILKTEVLIPLLLGWMLLGFLGASEFRGRITESRRSEVAREIVEGPGNWLVPTLSGQPFLTKPPLYYDMAAASMKLFGVNEGAARLPAALSCLIALGATFSAGRMWRGTPTGLLACLLMATTFLFLQNCRLAEIDGVLLAAISVSLMMIHGAIKATPRRKWWVLGLWGAMAVGFLAKGPHALMFPLGGILLAAWSLRGDKTGGLRSREIFSVAGIALFLLIVVPWFIYVSLNVPGTAQVFAHETLGRIPGLHQSFAAPALKGAARGSAHVRAPWYYIEKLPALLPWFPFAFAGGFLAWKKRTMADRFGPAYLIAGFVLLSLISSKKEVYLLPLVPVLSLLAAEILRPPGPEENRFSSWRRVCDWGFFSLALTGLTAVILVALWMAWKVTSPLGGVIVILLSGGLGVHLIFKAVIFPRSRAESGLVLTHSLLVMIIAISLGFHFIKPKYDRQKSFKAFAREMNDRLPADARIVFLDTENYAVMFYSGRILQTGVSVNELSSGDYVLLEPDKLSEIDRRFRYHLILDEDGFLSKKIRRRYVVLVLEDRRPSPDY